jgi:GH15 family glucan-1,4-alpha-glucosidase
MAWVAFDRAVRSIEEYWLAGDLERWRALRDEIHEEVCREGFDEELGSFTQFYGSGTLDASLLLIPLVGFLPCSDPRVRGTIEAVQRNLTWDGLVLRYRNEDDVDGLPAGEGVFLPCTFWLVDCLELLGDHESAHALFERLLSLCNDVGLIAEEYDPATKRLLGNFPQAFTHLELVNTAFNLAKGHPSPMKLRHAER